MKIKTYLVSSLAEAIERIKRDLGPEAVILSTKKTVLSDKWWNRDSGLEVTAAIDLPLKSREMSAPVSTTGQTMKIVSQLTEKMAEKQISPIKEEISRLRESLEQMVQVQKENAALLTQRTQVVEEVAKEIETLPNNVINLKEEIHPEVQSAPNTPNTPIQTHHDAFEDLSLESEKDIEADMPEEIELEEIETLEAEAEESSGIQDEELFESVALRILHSPFTVTTPALITSKKETFEPVREIPREISRPLLKTHTHNDIQIAKQVEYVSQEWLSEIHRQRKHIYEISLDLLSHRLRPQTVQDITNYLLEINPDGSRYQLREQAAEWLIDHLPDCRPFTVDPTRQNLVAMIGPTGSGKTTTLVKLASQLVLEQKQSIAFISLDHQRVGGKEQLKRHAAILKAPCLYARTPLQFQKALKSLEHFSVVLIDTAGCSPNDDRAVWELHQTLSCDKPVWKALVLPAILQEPDMTRTIRKFATARCQNLIITKLDETSCFGTLYNAPTNSTLTPAYFTMGQQIPEDFEVATKERIVDCLLNFSEMANEQTFENEYGTEVSMGRDLQ